MAILLALDTATEACSVAVWLHGETVEIFKVIPQLHSQKIIPMIDELLAQAGVTRSAVDAIAYGQGPGAFTGIRIAAAVTQGLAFALNRPVIPVSSLAALAQLAIRKYDADNILAAIDARMNEIYLGHFTRNKHTDAAVLTDQEMILMPENVSSVSGINQSWTGIGSGWVYQQRIPVTMQAVYSEEFPHAYDIATLSVPLFEDNKTIEPEFAVPVYLRNNVAKKSKH